MPFGRKSPLEALALPGAILAYKYSQFRQRRREAATKRITERELSVLHNKIDKLLSKLEESEPDPPTSLEDECVICINARATMQTSPCGHRVVCRRCFVKTIQSAVAQRLLPLRCVICRARVNRLTSFSGTWGMQESASSYSMGSKSWTSVGVSTSMPSADSYFLMNKIQNDHKTFTKNNRRNLNVHIAQSDSLYSVNSSDSSISGVSHTSTYSKISSISNDQCSPVSPISQTSCNLSPGLLKDHLPSQKKQSISLSLPSPSSSIGLISPQHSHHIGCPIGCSGAIPRKPKNSLSSGSCNSSDKNYSTCYTSSTHTYPVRRNAKARLVDPQNRLPPIKEFISPAKVPHPSPVHINKFRYASYTKPVSEVTTIIAEPPSPPKRPMNLRITSITTFESPQLKPGGSKVSPFNSRNTHPKNAYVVQKDRKCANAAKPISNITKNSQTSSVSKNDDKSIESTNRKLTFDTRGLSDSTNTLATCSKIINFNASSKGFPLFSSKYRKEKSDNKKNEFAERKKKEEKQKLKADKEAKKEEKRMAKEEENTAKILAKKDKKKGIK